MDKPKITDLIVQIERVRGNVSALARVYERPRSTVMSWIESSSTATQALEDARETRVDFAEHTVYKQMSEDNLSAAFYVLNNDPAAKRRGWGARLELEHSGKIDSDQRVKWIDYGLDEIDDDNSDASPD